MSRVIVKPSPLRQAREEVVVPAGLTVAEIVELVLPEPLARAQAIVELGGWRVARRLWRGLRPKEHAHLVVLVAPGGREGLRTVLQIGVTVAAIAAFALLAPYLGPVGAGAVAATIQAGGYLALNAFLPPAQPKLGGGNDRTSPAYAFDGARNEIRKWAPVPVLLGRCRMFPPFGAEPVTEVEGDKSYLNLLLMWSRGRVELEPLHVGDTPLAEYRGVETETVQADPETAPALTLFPADPTTLVVGAALTQATGFVTRRSARDADRLVIEIVYPGGLQGIGEKTGDRFGQSVTYEVQTAPAGAETWTSHGSFTQSGKTSSATRRAITLDVARGQYDVRVRRTTADATDQYRINAGEWLTLKSVTYRPPTRAKSRTATALRILATNQVYGTLDTVNAWGTSICLDFEAAAGTWIERATRNPASLFRFALQNFGRSKFLDEEIDLAKLEYWHTRNVAWGYTCDLYVDFRSTLLEILRIIAQCGRARPTRVDGKWSVVIDEPQGGPVQYFTPRNIIGFSARKLFVKDFHGFRVQFLDAEQGMKPDEVVVYRDGYDEATATELPELEAPGITDRGLAWAFGRWSIAQVLLRPEEYEVETDWQHIVCTAGDEVAIQHDAISVGTAWSVVKGVETEAGRVVAITVEGAVQLEPGRDYSLLVRRPAGGDQLFRLWTGGLGSCRLELDGAYAASLAPAPGDLAMVGERGQETLPAVVKAIVPGPDLTARLLCVPAAWVAENEPIPAFDPRVSAPSGALVPIILRVRSDSTVLARGADGTVHLELVVSLYSDGARSLTRIAGVEVAWAEEGSEGVWLTQTYPAGATECRLPGIQAGAVYLVAARFHYTDGSPGAWTGDVRHEVEGITLPPPDVPAGYLDGDRVSWSAPSPRPPDLAGYRVRWSPNPGTAYAAAQEFSEGRLTDTWLPIESVPDSAAELLIVAENTGGLVSAVPARVAVPAELRPAGIAWLAHDLRARGWPGELAGGEVDPGTGDLRAVGTAEFLAPAGQEFLAPATAEFLADSWQALAYTARWTLPATARATDRVRLVMVTEGELVVEYAWGTDGLTTWPLDQPLTAEVWSYATANRDLPLGRRLLTSSRPFRAWRAAVGARPGEVLKVRLTAGGGTGIRPRVKQLRLVLEGDELAEELQGVAISGTGTRLLLTKDFRAVSSVIPTPRADLGSPAGVVLIVAKDINGAGVVLRGAGADGNPLDLIADVRCGGV